MNENMERALDWNDEIVNDQGEFVLFPAGDYNFEITGFERGRFNGSDKLPPCNQATLTVRLKDDSGKETSVQHNLFLHTKTEGFLSAFFTSIGQKKKGEPLRMNWNKVIGSTGKCKVKIHTWKTREGEEMQSNEIARFYPKEETTFTPGQF